MNAVQLRIKGLVKDLGLSLSEFAKRIGTHQSSLSRSLADGNNVGDAMLNKISIAFGINKAWLLTGEGEMLRKKEEDALSRIGANRDKGDKENFVSEVTEQSSKEFRIVEFVDLHASAGPLGMNNIDILPDTNRRLIPREYESGNLLVVRVDGDSMNDGTPRSLYDGDEVLIVERTYNHWYDLPIRKNLFVICSRGGNVLKQISEINRIKGYIVSHSFNPSHADYRIAFEDIYQVFVVLHVVYRKISLD